VPAALTPRVLALALGAALGIGIVLALLQQGAQAEGSSGLSATAAARTVSVVLTLVAVAALRSPTTLPAGRRASVLAVGVADTGANALFAVASDAGQDALVAVLSSLYPVVTVLLARAVLAERLSRPQGAGVAVALVGVALASVS
jgi:drug/metabolite transporter (DMT)-like permease